MQVQVGVTLDVPYFLTAELESESVSVYMDLAKEKGLSEPEIVRCLFRSLATQLEGMARVFMMQCSFKPSKGPNKFWDWFTPWAKARIGFHKATHSTTAVNCTQQLLIFDGLNEADSLIVIRTFFTAIREKHDYYNCYRLARAKQQEHILITGFNARTLSTLQETTGSMLRTMLQKQEAFQARLSPFWPISAGSVELVADQGGCLLSSVPSSLERASTSQKSGDSRRVPNQQQGSLKAVVKKGTTSTTTGTTAAVDPDIVLPGLTEGPISVADAAALVAVEVHKAVRILLPEPGTEVSDQPVASQNGTKTLQGVMVGVMTDICSLDLEATLQHLDETDGSLTHMDWEDHSGDLRLLVDWIALAEGSYTANPAVQGVIQVAAPAPADTARADAQAPGPSSRGSPDRYTTLAAHRTCRLPSCSGRRARGGGETRTRTLCETGH
eukprot:3381350-Rhodomonas_salina.1